MIVTREVRALRAEGYQVSFRRLDYGDVRLLLCGPWNPDGSPKPGCGLVTVDSQTLHGALLKVST